MGSKAIFKTFFVYHLQLTNEHDNIPKILLWCSLATLSLIVVSGQI